MSAIRAAGDALEDVLKTVDGVRPYRDPGANIQPPGVLIGAPLLHWDLLDTAPSRATFRLYVLSREDDRALERIVDLVPLVAGAVATYDRATVLSPAAPGEWNAGGTALPAYVLNVDVVLEGN